MRGQHPSTVSIYRCSTNLIRNSPGYSGAPSNAAPFGLSTQNTERTLPNTYYVVCDSFDSLFLPTSDQQPISNRLYMDRVIACRPQEVRQTRRQRVIDQKLQAECVRGYSRSIALTAANRRQSRISSCSRSGYSESISCSDNPQMPHASHVAHLCRIYRYALKILHGVLNHCRNR